MNKQSLYQKKYKPGVMAGGAAGVLSGVIGAIILLLGVTSPAHAQGSAGPYVPTPMVIVDELLKLADIKRDEFVIDLGSGDGRIVVTAAKRYGATGYGIDIQPALVELATIGGKAAQPAAAGAGGFDLRGCGALCRLEGSYTRRREDCPSRLLRRQQRQGSPLLSSQRH